MENTFKNIIDEVANRCMKCEYIKICINTPIKPNKRVCRKEESYVTTRKD